MITIEVVCSGGCNHAPTHQPRQPQDPPEAVRLVYHNCADSKSYHYENAAGEKIAETQ